MMVCALTVGTSPVHASSSLEGIPPGNYSGVVFFTLTHSWTLTSAIMPVNDYSLVIDGRGSLRFTVRSDGSFSAMGLTIPSFSYVMAGQEVIKTDQPCKGFTSRGGGIGNAVAPPNLIAAQLFWPSVKLHSGEPWGDIQEDGDCGGMVDTGTLLESIKWDIESMPADRWDFTTDSRFTTKLAGTCTTELWQTPNRSITCYWQAFRIPSR
jgi:hypothetical protein